MAPSWDEEHGCLRKTRYSRKRAMSLAGEKQARGEKISPYRCPWSCGSWHIGHPPSIEGLERLAREIRARTGNAPGPPS